MDKDLVIGIDSSTSATKAIAWGKDGAHVCEGRESIPMANPAPGLFEQEADDWWSSTVSALSHVTTAVDPDRIAAISISNQRETFGIFTEDGAPVRSATVWLDERAREECADLEARVGADELRRISGKPVDVIVPINRMMWLAAKEPENFAKADRYADVHCYLCKHLTGTWMTSTASADPSGMLDLARGVWAEDLLSTAGIPMAMMPGLAKPGEQIGTVTEAAAAKTGLRAGTPLIAGGGDGQCAAAGAGAATDGLAYMNLGTAVVAGVYSKSYGHDLAFRTETAISDEGFIFETVLKSGTFLIDWFAREIAGGTPFETLEKEAEASPIGAGGVVLLPFWQGSMTPHWDANARGIMAGMSGSTTRGDLYRAVLEGLALDQAYALEKAMAATGARIDKIIAIGGGAASALFRQIIADSLNTPVYKAKVAEASALGAGMCAAKGAGWYPTLAEATVGMSQSDLVETKPIPANVARYAEFRAIYDDLWPQLATWNTRLWKFANQ